MKLTDMKSDFFLDSDTETDIINLCYEDIANGTFYFKNRILKYDFMGKKIEDSSDYITIKSIWYVDFKNKTKVEVVPFGEFDINEIRLMGKYLYFTKIIDKDKDGVLKNDYCSGEIHRINLKSLQIEYCCDIDPYNFHGFETATERYIVFISEDQIPDTTEIVFIDLKEKKKAVLMSIWDSDEMDYQFIYDEEQKPIYILLKRFVLDGELSSEKDKLMCFEWEDFLRKLEWSEM